MAALPNLITVEEFRQLPESGDYVYELHHGEIVAMCRPKPVHWILQRRLERLLQQKLASFGEAFVELPFRAVPEFDLRAADVGVMSRGRWDAMDRNDDFRGAPDLVVEVISPSNSKAILREMVSLCLNNGARECWLVDAPKRSVTVVRKDGTTSVYDRGSEIPLTAFDGDSLRV
jgi:Uma2 family endonuclease